MKHYIFFSIAIIFLASCSNEFEKEIGEVEGLNKIVLETEKAILTFDTAEIFSVKRQLAADIKVFENVSDTLDRKTIFALTNYYQGKKRLYNFTNNYGNYIKDIEYAKTQLANLKADLENSKLTREKFTEYYQTEQAEVMKLTTQINSSVEGLQGTVDLMKSERKNFTSILDSIQAGR